jgi:radical SAM superfamily enzyme YgiQ (UPF0313 family)
MISAMADQVLIIDALSAGSGKRRSSRDSIGCGPRAIAGVFEKHHVACRIQRVERVISKPSVLRTFDHIAVSAMSMDLPSVQGVVAAWHKGRRRGRVVVGGPISSEPELLSEVQADLFVVGEGEETLSELIASGFLEGEVDLSGVTGIAHRGPKGIVANPARSLLTSQELSGKYRPSTIRIVDYAAYQASKVYVEVIRGCSNFLRTSLPLADGRQCSSCGNCESDEADVRMECPEDIPPGCGFCSVPSTWGPPRSRSADAIVSEIKDLVDLGVHRVALEAPGFLDYMRGTHPLTDPCFPSANIDAIKELLHKINDLDAVRAGDVHISIENMKSCLFDETVARVLSEANLSTSPNIGIETGSAQHMKAIGKCGTPEEVVGAVRTAVKYGMKPFVYFIYGLPGETAQTVEESILMMKRLYDEGADRIILYGFRPLPGSAFAGYPPSSQEDELGLRLRREAEKMNRLRKDQYVGQIVRGIAAEPSWSRHGYTMVYPLEEGPIMTVHGGYTAGASLTIKITKVITSGLLEGEVVERRK